MNEEFVGPRRPRGRPKKGTPPVMNNNAVAQRAYRQRNTSNPEWRSQRSVYQKLWRTEEGHLGFVKKEDDPLRRAIYNQLYYLVEKDEQCV